MEEAQKVTAVLSGNERCGHCGQPVKWCDNPICVRITRHLIHVGTGIGACRGNRTTAMLDPAP